MHCFNRRAAEEARAHAKLLVINRFSAPPHLCGNNKVSSTKISSMNYVILTIARSGCDAAISCDTNDVAVHDKHASSWRLLRFAPKDTYLSTQIAVTL